MIRRLLMYALMVAACCAIPGTAQAAGGAYHHVHFSVQSAEEGAQWYIKHMGCQPISGRPTQAQCGATLLMFTPRASKGPTDGSSVNHIGFSFTNLPAKIKALEDAGVKIVEPIREVPALFKVAFVEDPWGTRIELLEDLETLGFHHIHLSSADPAKALAWYQQVFGGDKARFKDRADALRYDRVWVLAAVSKEPIAPTQGRVIDHIGFSFTDVEAFVSEMKAKGIKLDQDTQVIANSPVAAKITFVTSPDAVRIEVVEPPK